MSKRKIAVTFDDGPNPPYTNQLLDILEKYHAQGTFFLVGANVKEHPELVRDIHERGHTIGNHMYTHGLLETVSGQLFT